MEVSHHHVVKRLTRTSCVAFESFRQESKCKARLASSKASGCKFHVANSGRVPYQIGGPKAWKNVLAYRSASASIASCNAASRTYAAKCELVCSKFLSRSSVPSLRQPENRASARVRAAAQAQSAQEATEGKEGNAYPFHLDTAVLLAGFAFEAYNDEEEGIQEMSSCGTESIFLDESFVKELYSGRLKITLESASDLPGKSLTGTSDPYVVLTVGDSTVRSETMWRDLAPTWDADVSIFVSDPSRQALEIQVCDENVVGSDVLLASGSVTLDDFRNGTEQALELGLDVDLDDSKAGGGKDGAPEMKGKAEGSERKEGLGEGLGTARPKMKLKLRYEAFTEDTVLNRTLKAKEEESKQQVGSKDLVEKVSQALRLGKEESGKRPSFSTDLWGSHSERERTEGEDVEDLNDSESEDDEDDTSAGATSAAGKRAVSDAKRTVSDAHRSNSDAKRTVSDAKRTDSDGKRSDQRSARSRKRTGRKRLEGFSTDLWGAHSEQEVLEEETVEELNDSEDDDEDSDEDDVSMTSAKREKVVRNARENLLKTVSQAVESAGSLKVPGEGTPGMRGGFLKAVLALATCPCPCCLAELLADGPPAGHVSPETVREMRAQVDSKKRRGLANSTVEEVIAAGVLGFRNPLEVPWPERSGTLWNPPKAQVKVIEEKITEREQEEMAQVFADAESAVEAWTILADSLGKPGYVKSEFEKVVFVDHEGSDTQAAVWRDPWRKRIVVAFRGTESTEWKDLMTDVNLTPAKFEIDGEEVQCEGDGAEIVLHGGFKTAYDSVRSRLRTIVRALSQEPGLTSSPSDKSDRTSSMLRTVESVQAGIDDTGRGDAGMGGAGGSIVVKTAAMSWKERKGRGGKEKWSLLVTGHSLGGALATLFATEMAVVAKEEGSRIGHVAMYNFGSPRLGNREFADFYNRHVPDTWRLVNRDDVIPTVPRMMGYCHVGNALILGDKPGSPVKAEASGPANPDGKESQVEEDLLGEVSAKDFLPKLLRGEKALLKKVVEKELAMLDAFTDGSALLQHMEDFYYKALLKMVELHIGRGVKTPQAAQA